MPKVRKVPKWLDLIQTEGRPDLYKFQLALFTALALVFVAMRIGTTLEFPPLPAGLLALIGISNGVYLTAKASSKTAFEKLGKINPTTRFRGLTHNILYGSVGKLQHMVLEFYK